MLKRPGIAALVILPVLICGCDLNQLINPPDTRPVVSAGDDRCVGEGKTVRLEAGVVGEWPMTFLWTNESKPDGADDVTITESTSRVAFTDALTTQGEYSFRVLVVDSQNKSQFSWVHITVGPVGAEGDFCVSLDGPDSFAVFEETEFQATPDHESNFKYTWGEIDTNGNVGTNGLTFNPDDANTSGVTAIREGDTTIRVKVYDERSDETAWAYKDVRVTEQPELSVTIDGPEEAAVKEIVELTAIVENSSTEDVDFDWEIESGQAELGTNGVETVTVTPSATGLLQISVTVTEQEDGRRSATATHGITVNEGVPLDVIASVSEPIVVLDEEVELKAEAEGGIDDVECRWTVTGDADIGDLNACETTITPKAAETVYLKVTATRTSTEPTEVGESEVQLVAYDDGGTGQKPRMTIAIAGYGDLILEMEVEEAPGTVANFISYADEDFFDGLVFHRVVPDFVIQAGGYKPDGDELERVEPTYGPIPSEAPNGLSNIRGTVAMALQGSNADSATTQFFVNLVDNSASLDVGPPAFTVFATVSEGMDIVDEIAEVETGDRSGLTDVPVEDVIMTSVTRTPVE